MSAKKKLTLLIGAAALLLAVIIAIPIYLNATVFDRVVSDMLKEYPFANNARGRDGSYMKIDTNPDDKDIDDMTTLELMLYSSTSEDSLDAIEYVNERLGFSGAVFDDMLNTTALMGRQRQSNRKYTVSWTYHPDRGLEVTYEKN